MKTLLIALSFILICFTLHAEESVVSWVHIGDLHITTPQEQNYSDFQTLVKQVNEHLKDSVSFVFLPGDNANEGTEAEFQMIKKVTDTLQVPLFVVAGDHDAQSGNLELFSKYLAPEVYKSKVIGSYRFLFVNAPDTSGEEKAEFGFSEKQMAWLKGELASSMSEKQTPILLLHCFPENLGPSKPDFLNLVQEHKVPLVEVGHTHYNALANDGRTIYAATRSTGQVKEGPVGFSITNLDHNIVSWKFKPLGDWPFVMITSPSDRRFVIDPKAADQIIRGTIEIHAKVFGGAATAATFQVDGREKIAMTRTDQPGIWMAKWDSTKAECGDHSLRVSVQTADGKTAGDQIIVTVNQTGAFIPAPRSAGADGNSIGIDPDRGLLGTTQGPGGKPSWAGKGQPHDKADEKD